ncbi:hypothetical protein CY34DRAFT_19412 [Suillus luteus UH-Slu-Lm8-n1]|uniref:Uncharacterized protein n=1 Tax=Suillus luteus UH-Slu-Lm8-n1 TaxID=930992 RepID=A0A0D0ACJ2_9AGAM|nr:hypothetical protein CY34DRAFT_19412 [Suillus luteus UH-Slu-Lm8-n1]
MARKHAWDHALEDAIKSISIQPSLTGYISKCIALCGKGLVWEAMVAFDIASAEIPVQDQYGYDTVPNFFLGMQEYSRTSRLRPQSRIGRLKRFRLAMTRSEKNPPPAPPITAPPVTTTALKTHLRHLFTWLPHHTTPPAVDVHFAQGLQHDAELIPDEDYHAFLSPDPNMQQQHQAVAVQVDYGEHGGGRSCCC